jgi:hypothetical protein
VNQKQAPGQAPVPARYLNGNLVSVIATDYGGYAVTFTVSQLPPPLFSATGRYGCPGIHRVRHRSGTAGRESGPVTTGATGGQDG